MGVVAVRDIWFCSDWHLGHENIIKYCNRPFSSAAEMNDVMIQRHNALVKPSDKVYMLGDVAMSKKYLPLVRAFNGHKRLLRGNHDIYKTKDYMEAGFEEISAIRVMANMLFTHIPIHEQSMGRFDACVHGHTHDNVVTKQERGETVVDLRYLNICVEHTEYKPITLEDIQKVMRDRKGTIIE